MGSQQSTQLYAIPVCAPSENESCVYRAASHPDHLVDSLQESELRNCWDVFQLGRTRSKGSSCIGWRPRVADGTHEENYRWLTYDEVHELALIVGSGLLNLNCLPEVSFEDDTVTNNKPFQLLGIHSKNRPEWFIMEQASNAFNFATVPLYDTLGQDALHYILVQTQMPSVAASAESLPSLLAICEGTKLENIILLDSMDDLTPEQLTRAKELNVKIVSYMEVIASGKSHTLAPSPGGREDVHTICYTSGTTGAPKGVVHHQNTFVSLVSASQRGPLGSIELEVSQSDVHISYLPLAHMFERVICNILYGVGASIGLYSGDTLKLLDDIRVLQPTIFISVPRLFNRINDRIQNNLGDKPFLVQYLFNLGIATKVANFRQRAATTHSLWDTLVFNKTKNFLGGRLRYMVVGGAPLAPEIQERMAVIFCCPLLEGYGLTESMGATFIQIPSDCIKGSVGGILPCNEFKLRSVPHMDYNTTDDPPRGELLLRGKGLFKGYFRNAEACESVIDSEGWFSTGDICVLLPNHSVKIVDRAKSMFKLAQGEYVAPEKMEQVYTQSLFISQAFVTGLSTKSFLVAIIIPDEDYSEKWAVLHKKQGLSLAELCKDEEFKAAIIADMDVVGHRADLRGFEKVKVVHLESDQFSVENSMLTPTLKIRRHTARERYDDIIVNMYSEAEV
eukprot:Lankesteria_metandrocarpae@DN6096_c0_g1_i1.p1